MRLFLMIHSVLTEISFLVPGIEILPIVLKIEAEAGGMATIVIVLFGQILTVFIGVVEMKPGPISSEQDKPPDTKQDKQHASSRSGSNH